MAFRAAILIMFFAAQLAALPPSTGQVLNSEFAKGSNVTYVDLLRFVCPDLEVDDDDPAQATATTAIAVRDLGASQAAKPGEANLEADIVLESVKTVALLKSSAALLKSPAPRALIAFAMTTSDTDQPIRMLALFDLNSVRLLDIVAVSGFPDDVGDFDSTIELIPILTRTSSTPITAIRRRAISFRLSCSFAAIALSRLQP